MPSIQVTGQLVDPTTGVEGSADIRIASLINYGQTTKKSISHKSTGASGNYDFQLVHGKHLIFVKYEDERIYIPVGYAVVGDSTPDPVDLIQLINLSDENPPSELVTDLQQLREDTLNDIVSTSAEVLENAGYKGLWPDTGGGALKGETWQTQVGGTPTGEYFTALQNTTVDPVGDNVNWKAVNDYGSVSGDGLTVKHRRGTNAEILAGTPDIGELWLNTTDNSIHMGDGTTLGGIKQSSVINVKNFGAKGDGTTDDTAAIQTAFDSASSITITDKHLVSDTVTLPSGKTLLFVGDGELITDSSWDLTLNKDILSLQDRCTVFNAKISGDRNNFSLSTWWFGLGSSPDSRVTASVQYGVGFRGDDSKVYGVRCSELAGSGITFTGANNNKVFGYECINCGAPDAVALDSQQVFGHEYGDGIYCDEQAKGNLVSGFTIQMKEVAGQSVSGPCRIGIANTDDRLNTFENGEINNYHRTFQLETNAETEVVDGNVYKNIRINRFGDSQLTLIIEDTQAFSGRDNNVRNCKFIDIIELNDGAGSLTKGTNRAAANKWILGAYGSGVFNNQLIRCKTNKSSYITGDGYFLDSCELLEVSNDLSTDPSAISSMTFKDCIFNNRLVITYTGVLDFKGGEIRKAGTRIGSNIEKRFSLTQEASGTKDVRCRIERLKFTGNVGSDGDSPYVAKFTSSASIFGCEAKANSIGGGTSYVFFLQGSSSFYELSENEYYMTGGVNYIYGFDAEKIRVNDNLIGYAVSGIAEFISGSSNLSSSIPTTGAWYRGETVLNHFVDPGEYSGWICTTAGDFTSTPPVFKGYGLVEV